MTEDPADREAPGSPEAAMQTGAYREIVERSHDGIYVYLYDDDRFHMVNRRLCELLGYARDELLEKSVEDIIHPDDLESVRSYGSARSRGESAPVGYVARVLTSSGETRYFDFSVSGSTWHGRPCAVGSIRDITERRLSEKRMARLNDELIKLDKLESIGMLAGGLAHDFNNALTAVLGNVQLAEGTCSAKGREYLRQARSACERASDLTSQLLTFARGGSPAMAEVDLRSLFPEVCSFSLSGSSVRCKLDVREDTWPVTGDRDQLFQAFHNLIQNARQALPEGGEIRVSTVNVPEGGAPSGVSRKVRSVRVSVEDGGRGIDEEDLLRVFDPFFTTREEARGLGLSIVHSIVRRHDGYVTIDSAPGAGTRVSIYLPAFAGGGSDVLERIRPVERPRVLLMDDELMIRNVGREMLQLLDCVVETAADGREALDLYVRAGESGRPFDLVILDVTVPGGVGGERAVRMIRRVDPSARVIVSSGYANSPVLADYRRYGFSAVMRKPYTIEEVRRAVSEAFEAGAPPALETSDG